MAEKNETRLEPVFQHVRAFIGNDALVDSVEAKLLFEPGKIPAYHFPPNDVKVDQLPEGTWSEREGLLRVKWDAFDAWFEEDERVYVHAKNPYHRIDVFDSRRHVEVFADGQLIADSKRARIVVETNMAPRFYIPRMDVRMDLLEHVEKQTGCPYKGFAHYWNIKTDARLHRNRAWSYEQPLREALRIAGMICFYQEKLDVHVDGQKL